MSAEFTRLYTEAHDQAPNRWAAAGFDAALDTTGLPFAQGPVAWKDKGKPRRRSLPVIQLTAAGPTFVERVSLP